MSERDELLNYQETENKETTQEQNTSEELETTKEQDTTEEQESQEQEEIQENVDKQRQNKINEKVQGLVNNINNAVKKIQMIVHAILSTIIGIGLFLISPVGLIVEALLITVLVISSGAQVYGPNNMVNDKVSTEAPDVDFINGSEREHAIGLYFANNGVNPSASAYLAKSFKDNHYINMTLDSKCNTECLVKMIQNNEILNLSIGGYQATDTEQWKDASDIVMKAYKANKQWYNSAIQLKAMMDVVNKLGHTEGSKLFTLDSGDISGAKIAVRSEEDYDLTELVKYINDNRSVGKMLGSGLGKSRVNGGKASDTSGFGDASYNDNKAKVDGTGTYNPADGSIWTDTRFEPHVARRQIGLPDSIAPYAIDPTKVGLLWSDEASWYLKCYDYANCTDAASNLAYRLWSKDGQPAENVMGNGGQVTSFWQKKGIPKINIPKRGNVFSVDYAPGLAGHTGIVSHVFEDGTMLIWEQNVAGWSGAENGSPRTWNWRIIPASEWQSGRWSFTDFEAAGYQLKIGYVK
jgi:surface antigen